MYVMYRNCFQKLLMYFILFADRILWCHLVAQFSRFPSWIFSGRKLQLDEKKYLPINWFIFILFYFQEYNNYSSLHHAYMVQDYSNHTFHISLTGMEFQFHEKNILICLCLFFSWNLNFFSFSPRIDCIRRGHGQSSRRSQNLCFHCQTKRIIIFRSQSFTSLEA